MQVLQLDQIFNVGYEEDRLQVLQLASTGLGFVMQVL
jgi:hypothetical protein